MSVSTAMRTCERCGVEHAGRRALCRDCNDVENYEANKEKVAERKRAYYEANKEKVAERKRAYLRRLHEDARRYPELMGDR